MSETETPQVVEPSKPSKSSRIKSVAFTAGIIVIPTAVVLGGSLIGFKTSQNTLEAARLQLETAKLINQ